MKAQNVLNKILTELASIRKVEFAQMNLENGTVLEAEAFEPENEVFVISGEDRVPAPVGEHKLEDGKILVVVEEGIISEIKEAEAPEVEEVEMQSEEAVAVAEEVAADVADEAADAISEEVSDAIEVAVAEALVPVVEEVAAEMKKLREELASAKTEMAAMEKKFSSQSAARPIKHNPAKPESKQAMFSSKRQPNTLDRVLAKLNN
jgi:hypothetical protein